MNNFAIFIFINFTITPKEFIVMYYLVYGFKLWFMIMIFEI